MVSKSLSLVITLLLLATFLVGCASTATNNMVKEAQQQATGIDAILNNQPVPDLGGWSFERQVVIDTYIARNKQVNTFTYLFLEYSGKIVEICPSKGYPIPYATQLTNPLMAYNSSLALGNPEPSSLYPPSSANATLVQCVLDSGKVVPTYWENNVFSTPFRIKADMVLSPTSDSSFSLNLK